GDARHHPRRDVRLDRRAPGAQPDRARQAVLPVLLRPRLSGGRREATARLPRQRDPVCAGHGRRHPAALAGDSRHRCGAAAGRGHARLLDRVRARRRSVCGRRTRLARLRRRARLHAFRRHAAAGRTPDAGHVRTGRDGSVPAPRPRRPALALERRHHLAAAAAGGGWMSVMHGDMQPFALTLDRFLDHGAKWYPEVEVVTARGDGARDRIDHAGLRERSRRLSAVFAGMGVGLGDCVATLAWNTRAHMETWFAVMGMGAVCHTLNPRLGEAHLLAMLERSRARLLVVAADLAPIARCIAARAGCLERVLVIDGVAEDDDGVIALEPLEPMIESARGEVAWGDFDERTPCGLCFTSGTTGAPKGVT